MASLRESNRELVPAATVAQAEDTFATTIAASSDGASYSNATAARIPARFADVIGSIDGLDNLRHWVPITSRPPMPGGLLEASSAYRLRSTPRPGRRPMRGSTGV